MSARHEDAAALYDKASSVAPAFGMVGTLVGLINMLKSMNLSGDGGARSLQLAPPPPLLFFLIAIPAHLSFREPVRLVRRQQLCAPPGGISHSGRCQ